jgi:2-C-methyl-D-erythritol 2,4-cyclodiphosphate synthase
MIGLGFDVHPRARDPRPLFLGGARFEDDVNGLQGHSDGDAVCHALADALLGARGSATGEHFPEDDLKTEGIPGSSCSPARWRRLRARSAPVPTSRSWPSVRRSARRDEIRRHLAPRSAAPGRVSVKATRPEGLGLTGYGAACIALAVVTGS